MYESFYGFSRRPFTAIPDADCYVPLATAQDAVAELLLCVQQGDGIAVLTSPAGLGKSLLCRHLAELLKEQFEPVLLPQAGFDTPQSLLQSVLYELGTAWSGMTENEMRLELKTLLAEAAGEGRPIVLIFDEAHLLQPPLLEEIRCLANLEHSGRPQARIVLSGQLELEETLAAPGLEAFNQRIRCQTTLPPLSQLESAEYLMGRLQQVGTDLGSVFSREAVTLICRASDGNPRCLNQLSDQALLLGYISEEIPVGEETVRDALDDLRQLPLHWNIPSRSTSAESEQELEAADTAWEGAAATGSSDDSDDWYEDDSAALIEDNPADVAPDETASTAELDADAADSDTPEADPQPPVETAFFEVGEEAEESKVWSFDPPAPAAGTGDGLDPAASAADPATAETAAAVSPQMDRTEADPAETDEAADCEVGVFECGAGDAEDDAAETGIADFAEATEPVSEQPLQADVPPQQTQESFAETALEVGELEEEPADDAETELIVNPPADRRAADRGMESEDLEAAEDETHCIEFGVSDGDEMEEWATGEWTSFDSRNEADELAELLTFDSHLSTAAESIEPEAEPTSEPTVAAETSRGSAPVRENTVAGEGTAPTLQTIIDTAGQQVQDLVQPAGDGWIPFETAAASESGIAGGAAVEHAATGNIAAEDLSAETGAAESAAERLPGDMPADDELAETPAGDDIAAESDIAEDVAPGEPAEELADEPAAAGEPVGTVPAEQAQQLNASTSMGNWEPVELRSRTGADRQQLPLTDLSPARLPAPGVLGPVRSVSSLVPATGATTTFQEQEVLDPYARLESGRPAALPELPLTNVQAAAEISGQDAAVAPPDVTDSSPSDNQTANLPVEDHASRPEEMEQEAVAEPADSFLDSEAVDRDLVETDSAAAETPELESTGEAAPADSAPADRSTNPLEALDRASRLVEEALNEPAAAADVSAGTVASDTEDLDEASRLTPLSTGEDLVDSETADAATAEVSAGVEEGRPEPADLTAEEIARLTPEDDPLEEQIGKAVLETSFDAQRVVEQRLDQMIAGQRQAHRPEVNDWEPVTPSSESAEEQHEPVSPPFDPAPLTDPASHPASDAASEELSDPLPAATTAAPEEQARHEPSPIDGQPAQAGPRRRFARLFTDLRHRAASRSGHAGRADV